MPKRRVDEQQGRAALAAWERAYVAAHAPTAPDSTAADSTTVDPELSRPVLFTCWKKSRRFTRGEPWKYVSPRPEPHRSCPAPHTGEAPRPRSSKQTP